MKNMTCPCLEQKGNGTNNKRCKIVRLLKNVSVPPVTQNY